jgi:DNA topoisomerase II
MRPRAGRLSTIKVWEPPPAKKPRSISQTLNVSYLLFLGCGWGQWRHAISHCRALLFLLPSTTGHEIKFETLSVDVEDLSENEAEGAVPDKTKSGTDLIDMVFSKTRVEDRKDWLNKLEADTYLDYSKAQKKGVKYSDFVNRELILFSRSDNMRSIPHFVDGFKPSQRKVLFACFKKNLKKEIKVAQLAGYVGEKSAYHHGEVR